MDKVTTLANYPEDYNKPDYFYWKPRKPFGVSSRERQWVGSFVTVTCWQMALAEAGRDEQGDPLWRLAWFGYVKEINKYIPEGELLG